MDYENFVKSAEEINNLHNVNYLETKDLNDFNWKAAYYICKEIYDKQQINKDGYVVIGLSGGRTPIDVYKNMCLIKDIKIDKSKLIFFIIDERYKSDDHKFSNYNNIKFLFHNLNINEKEQLYKPDTTKSIVDCILDYNDKIKIMIEKYKKVDIAILGMGSDFHIASLFPNIFYNIYMNNYQNNYIYNEKTLDFINNDQDNDNLKYLKEYVYFTTTNQFDVRKRITVSLNLLANASSKIFLLNSKDKLDLWKNMLIKSYIEVNYNLYPATYLIDTSCTNENVNINNNNNNNNKNKNKQNTNKKNNKIINEFDDDIDEVSEENLLNDEEKKQNKIKNKNINETNNISENNEIEISSKDLTEQYEDKYNYDKKNNMGTNNNFNNTNTFANNKNNLHNKYINHASHTQNEKDILKHNFYGKDNNGTYEIIKVETHICANLNEKPNPSTLLEGALIAENEAQLQKIKKKYKVTDNEICVRPTNSSYVSLIPDKKYYLLGEKIEFKCQEGYKIIGTTNIGVCTGRNIISPNITCESLTNFDDVEKDNIQKMNNIINSASKYTFYNIIIIVFIIINLFFCA